MASRKHRRSREKTLSPDVGSISLAEWAKLPLRDRLLHVEHVTAKWVQERVAIDGKKWRGEGENGVFLASRAFWAMPRQPCQLAHAPHTRTASSLHSAIIRSVQIVSLSA